MIFSVFDHHGRCFNYYEAPGTSKNYGSRGTKYRAPTQPPQGPPQLSGAGRNIGPIGFAPESLALPLPSNARQIGRGQQARGIIATIRSESRDRGLGDATTPTGVSPGVVEVNVPRYPFGTTLAAACIAAVVGVLVQRMLR